MMRSDRRTRRVGAWMAAAALVGAAFAGAPVAAADVNVNIDMAPAIEVTTEPEEITATTEPPDPIYEEPVDAPAPGYVWVGGSWGWTGSDWGWYPGRWLLAPEGQVYVEPYYERVGPNVVFVRGYWGPRDAPRHTYGGDRIRFAPPVRPADYRRGEPPRFERRVGAPPGTRPAGFYEHQVGPARPLPRATAPAYRAASREVRPARSEPAHARNAPAGREGPAAHERPASPHENPAAHERPAPAREPPAAHYAPAQHSAPVARSAPAARAAPAPAAHAAPQQKHH
jgi:hypothetical protein